MSRVVRGFLLTVLILPWLAVIEAVRVVRGVPCASCGRRYGECWDDLMVGLA